MNVTELIKLIRDGLDAAGKNKVPVVPPGTPISVLPCVAVIPANDSLDDGNRTLRLGFEIKPSVPRQSQVPQYGLLTELQIIVLQSIRPSSVRFDGPMTFSATGELQGEPPAQARVIPISFAADVDLC